MTRCTLRRAVHVWIQHDGHKTKSPLSHEGSLSFVFCFWPQQKEGDQQVTVQVEGRLTAFTQTGLAAGQEYIVSISGETDGRRGAESAAEFTTRELFANLSVDTDFSLSRSEKFYVFPPVVFQSSLVPPTSELSRQPRWLQ